MKRQGDKVIAISTRLCIWLGCAGMAFSGSVSISQTTGTAQHTRPRPDPNHKLNFELPSKWMNLGQSGTCLVHFQVDTDGEIRAAQIVRSSGFPHLDEACVHNFLHSTFLPATQQGVPIVEWATWPINMNAKSLPAGIRDSSGVPQIQPSFSLKIDLKDHPDVVRKVGAYKDCRVRAWVRADAHVEKAEITQSTGIDELDRACQAAVEAAAFTAARRDGAEIDGSVEITMRWKNL